MEIKINFDKKTGKDLKAVNGVCNGPVVEEKTCTELYKAARFPFVRLHDTCYASYPYYVDISHIFPNFDADENDPSNYLFQHTDYLIAEIYKSGAQPIYRLGESIDHSIFKRHTHPPKDFAKWVRICLNIVKHYNDGWDNGFHYGIKWWEVWNEPDLQRADGTSPMWNGGTLEDACRLYKMTATALKEHDPSLLVGGMAMTSVNESLQKFVEYCGKERLPLDFCSYHGYGDDVTELRDRSAKVRQILDENGFKNTLILFDEWNYFGREGMGSGELWKAYKADTKIAKELFESQGNETGASYVAAALIGMNDFDIDVASYYDGQYDVEWCGLFDRYCNILHPYTVFKFYGEMLALAPQRVEVENDNDGLWCVATENDTTKYVMLADYRGGEGPCTFSFNGLGSGVKQAEVYVTDKNSLGELSKVEYYCGEDVKQILNLKNHTVAFIKITTK
ncbi:MAG: hypothetical protein ACI4N6_00475 [Eubacteriales bacterium]